MSDYPSDVSVFHATQARRIRELVVLKIRLVEVLKYASPFIDNAHVRQCVAEAIAAAEGR